jgi:hypothetical protein
MIFRAASFIATSTWTILFASASIAEFFKAEPHAASLFKMILAPAAYDESRMEKVEKVNIPQISNFSVVIPDRSLVPLGNEMFLLDFPAGRNLLDERGTEPLLVQGMPNYLAAHRTTTP